MKQIVLLNKNGFTLVEVLVALVIALIVFLALMQTALIGIDSNMRNILRDEAVRIAEMRISGARNVPFTDLVSDSTPIPDCNCPDGFSSSGECLSRDFRKLQNFNFCTNVVCQELDGDGNCATNDSDNKQINVTIGWKWKGEDFIHTITTIRRRND